MDEEKQNEAKKPRELVGAFAAPSNWNVLELTTQI